MFEQLTFLQAHHEEIERGIVAQKLGNYAALDDLLTSAAFQRLFGHLPWDDIYDRYQSSADYDFTLAKQLHQKLQDDLAAGRVRQIEPPIPSKRARSQHIGTDEKLGMDDVIVFDEHPAFEQYGDLFDESE